MKNIRYSLTEFESTLEYFLASMAQNYAELGEPVDMPQEAYEAFLKNVKVQSQYQHSDCTFYMAVNHKTTELEWLYQIDKALGVPNDLSSMAFFKLIHPDYFKMYMIWALCAADFAAVESNPRIRPLSHTYHITLPLRRNDGTYHWFHQQSRPLRMDANGQMCVFFNTYQYGGEWNEYTLRPLIPHVTFDNAPKSDITTRLTVHFCKFIKQFFTLKELEIIKLYATDLSVEEAAQAMHIKRLTLLDYNKSILGKANTLFCYQFDTAKRAAKFLTEKKLIPPYVGDSFVQTTR